MARAVFVVGGDVGQFPLALELSNQESEGPSSWSGVQYFRVSENVKFDNLRGPRFQLDNFFWVSAEPQLDNLPGARASTFRRRVARTQ